MRLGSAISVVCAVVAISSLIGCGSSHKNSVGPITSVTLNPSPSSLNAGDVLQLQAGATDAQGHNVFNQTFSFSVTPINGTPANAIQVSTTGLLCAGTWDSLTAPVNCIAPGAAGSSVAATPLSGYQATITATAGGVNSTAITVYVHQKIVSITVTSSAASCVSQTGTSQLTAHAASTQGDITASIGSFNWTISSATLATLTAATTSGATAPQNAITAKLPGAVQVSASANTVNTINSVPVGFTECAVASISISPAPVIALTAAGKTQQMTATVTDTNSQPVANVPLLWSSSEPTTATVSSTGQVTAVAPGTTSIIASCTPNACNTNLNQPIYSNAAIANVPGTSSTTVYATCSTAIPVANCPATSAGGPNLVPISTSTNTAGTAIALAHVPNSLVFSRDGAKGFLGSSGGLILLNPASNTITNTITNMPGIVLAVSPDGNSVITWDAASNNTLFLNETGNSVTGLNIPNAVSADFTPDGSKLFVLSQASPAAPATDGLYVFQPGGAVQKVALSFTPNQPPTGAARQSITMLANGDYAYFAASTTPFISNCGTPGAPVTGNGPGGSPLLVRTLPNGSGIVGADSPNLDLITAAVAATGCPPALTNSLATIALGSAFVPQQVIVTPDSQHAYITSNVTGSLLGANLGTPAAASVALAGGASTFTGGATPDSSSIYVGGSDGNVHVITVSTGTDSKLVPMTFTPDLVAVRP